MDSCKVLARNWIRRSPDPNFSTVSKTDDISERDERPDIVVRFRIFDAKASRIVDFQVTKEGQIYSIGKAPDTDKK